MADLLEFLIRVAGGGEAAAQVKGVRDSFVELGASAKAAGGEMAAAEGAGAKFGAVLGSIGKGSLVVGAALAAVGAEAVKMSNSFNTEMLKIQTEGGATRKELVRMKGAVLDLATSGQSMGQGPVALAQGLYHLESMGLRGAKALHALKLASQEAAISGASLEDTTTSLGGAMFVGIKGVSNITKLMGSLNAIAGAGNMRFQDLNEALGTGLLGSAKLAHLSLQETGAALAVLTDSGYHASSAAAQLGTALHYLYAPSDKGTKALASIGLTGNKLSQDLRKPQGLLAALKDLRTHIHQAGANPQDVLDAILPGGRGRVLLNLFQMQNRLAPKYGQILGTGGDFGQHVAAQRSNPSTELATSVAKLQGNMVKLGNSTSKLVTPALLALTNIGNAFLVLLQGIPAAISRVVGWFEKNRTAALAIGTALGIVTGAFVLWKGAVFAATVATRAFTVAEGLLNLVMDANPIALVVTAIAALVGGLVYAYEKVGWFRKGIQDAWSWIKTATTDVVNWVTNAWGNATHFIGQIPGKILGFFKGLGSDLVRIFDDIVNTAIIGPINWVIGKLNQFNIHLPGFLGGGHIGIHLSPLGLLGQGAPAAPPTIGSAGPGATKTTGGVQIHPHAQVIHEHIHVMVDGRELGRAMRRRQQIAMMGSHA